jgi:hypothetical protein
MTTISIRIAGSSKVADARTSAAAATTSIWERIVRTFRSAWCVINGGHYKVLHTEPARLSLRCVACGHMSPGWEVGAPRLRRAPATPERVRANRPVAA